MPYIIHPLQGKKYLSNLNSNLFWRAIFSFATETSLEARLERAMAEPDYEREEIFQYLKEFRSRVRNKNH